MKRPLFIFLTALLIGGLVVAWWFAGRSGEDEPPIPDEKRAAMIALEQKQSGPGYFHAEPGTVPDEDGLRWLAPDKAAGQINRILRERKLDESEREKLTRLIDEISEPYPSRTIGGDRVNLARLNVALDANAR